MPTSWTACCAAAAAARPTTICSWPTSTATARPTCALETYADRQRWNQMSLINVARSGIFAADRSIRDYARDICTCPPVPEHHQSKRGPYCGPRFSSCKM